MSDSTQRMSDTAADLPGDKRCRRLAITTLTNRSVANRRERDMCELAGEDGKYLVEDYISASTSAVAAQLLLTEHLLDRGWSFTEILRSVWYRDEALRSAAQRD